METNKYIEKIKGIAKKIQEHLPIGVKKWAISLAFVATVLTACGKTVETNNPTNPVPDTTIETVVEPIDEEKTEPNIEEDHNKTPDDQEVKPEENNLPEPTFVQTSENNYTVAVNCPDNSNAPEVQTAQGYSYVIEHSDIGGISPNLITAIVAAGVKEGGNYSQVNFDAYKDNVFTVNDMLYGDQPSVVFTENPDSYDKSICRITREDYNSFSQNYQYAMSLVVQHAFAETDYNLSCALEYYHDPVEWEQIMQEFEAQTGLTKAEAYANYDARTIYETLGKEYPGFAEEVISMISPDEQVYATRIEDGGTYSQVTYDFERTKVKLK